MSHTLSLLRLGKAAGLTLLAAALAYADSLTLVTSQAAQAANDTIAWSQLGPDGTLLASNLTVHTVAKNVSAGVVLAGSGSIPSVMCPATVCSWTGTGFPAASTLLWTSDAGNGGNGPVKLTFASGIAGAGASIQADGPGAFTAQIEAFNGATSLGSLIVLSDVAGGPAYIGVKDQTGPNITSIVFSLTRSAGLTSDFALGTVSVNLPTGAPAVTLSRTSIAFGSQPVGTVSTAQAVTVTNSGTAPLSITSISNTGDFKATNTCGAPVAAGASCSISITFAPTVSGARTGTLSIVDNATGSPHLVQLSGTGGQPIVSLSATTLAFGNQNLRTTSPAKTATLSNTGNAPLSITSIVAAGDFKVTNNCGSSLAAGAACTLSVAFAPTALGARTGTVTITDNAAGSPHLVHLTGTGVQPVVALSASTLAFANQIVNTASAAKTVTLSNTGTGTLALTSIVPSGDFKVTHTCGSSVAAGTSCTISVSFVPTVLGSRTGTVTITDNATGSPHLIALSGNGVSAAVVNLSPASLSFAVQLINTTSAAKTVTLRNAGTGPLDITSIAVTGSFVQTHTCGTSLAAGATCTISVTFRPLTSGPSSGSVKIVDNAAGSPHMIPLTGTGTQVKLSASAVAFGIVNVGSVSAPHSVTLTNVGTSALAFTTIGLIGANTADFTEGNTCGASIAAGASCILTMRFAPTATAARTAAVSISDDGGGSPQKITLSGTGQ